LDNTAYSYWQDETGNKAIADTVLRATLEDPNGKIIQSYIGNEDDKSYLHSSNGSNIQQQHNSNQSTLSDFTT